MWRAIAPAFIAALASTAGAQTVVTRSGEHDSFSRLVMRLPDGVAWSLTAVRLAEDGTERGRVR